MLPQKPGTESAREKACSPWNTNCPATWSHRLRQFKKTGPLWAERRPPFPPHGHRQYKARDTYRLQHKKNGLQLHWNPSVFLWSGWRDLNARPQRPERCALAKLSHIPLQERTLHRRPAVCKLFFQKNFSPLMSGGIRSCPAESRTWRYMFCAYRAIRL